MTENVCCCSAEERPGQCCNTCEEVKLAYRAKGWALANLDHIEQCVAIGETGHEMAEELERGAQCIFFLTRLLMPCDPQVTGAARMATWR